MKKIFVLTLIMIFVVSVGALAVDVDRFEATHGYDHYVTFDQTFSHADGTESELPKDFTDNVKSLGQYSGLRYWVNNALAIEGGFMEESSTYSGADVEGLGVSIEDTLAGPYVKGVYSLGELFENEVVELIKLSGGVAFYGYESSLTLEEEEGLAKAVDLQAGKGLSAFVGAEAEYPLAHGFSVVGNVNYRLTNVDVTTVWDPLSDTVIDEVEDESFASQGAAFGLGLNYNF